MNRPLKDISTADLLADGIELPVKPELHWRKWLEVEEIYPGQTKVSAAALYAEYILWCTANLVDPLTLTKWGILMLTRFNRHRARSGHVYLVSRSSKPSVTPELLEQMRAKLSRG